MLLFVSLELVLGLEFEKYLALSVDFRYEFLLSFHTEWNTIFNQIFLVSSLQELAYLLET